MVIDKKNRLLRASRSETNCASNQMVSFRMPLVWTSTYKYLLVLHLSVKNIDLMPFR